MFRLAWPAGCCTSRRDPPASEALQAARVMKVRRPEWEEHPAKPSAGYRRRVAVCFAGGEDLGAWLVEHS